MADYNNFQELCQKSEYGARFLKPKKVAIELALKEARVKGVKSTLIEEVEERGMLDGSFDVTYPEYENIVERIYNKVVNPNTSNEEREILDSFDQVRDADLIANYLFCVHPEIREKVKSADNLYKVVLKIGSKRNKTREIPEQESSDINSSVMSSRLESLIENIPREEYTGEREYQRRLRVLLRIKAERETFKDFKESYEHAFQKIDDRINNAKSENLRDAYRELKRVYQEYRELEPLEVNSEFEDPQTHRKGVLPSLHQRIALYHAIKEKRFGVFDGCGTGKTAIATLLQPLIEKELREQRKEFRRAVVVGPNPSKKAWKKGLVGESHQRYLACPQNIAVINGERKDEDFLKDLESKKWIVLNYEQLTTKVNGTKELLVDYLIRLGYDYVISDESHKIKSQRNCTKGENLTQSAAFRKLAAHSEYLTLLTGSPIPDKMEDYAVLYHLLNPQECPTPEHFKKLYEENPRILYTLFNNKTVRRTSEDINDDLEIEENEELIDLDPVQLQLYQHILINRSKSWLMQARKAILDPRLVHPRILKANGLLGKINYSHSAKYKRLEEMVTSDEGPVAQGENFVIFSSMFREGVTQKENEALRIEYVKLGIEEEFDKAYGLERRILLHALSKEETSLEKIKRKIICKKNKSEEQIDQEEKEFDTSVKSLQKKGYISAQKGVMRVATNTNGTVNRYAAMYKNLGFDVTLTEHIEKALENKFGKKLKIGVIDGTIEDIDYREKIADELGKDLVGIGCTTDTGGESLDFTAANHAYFLDRDYSPKTEEQAIGREGRKGQKKRVHIYQFIGKDSADESLDEYLDKKKLIIRTAVDGHPITEDEQRFLEDISGKQFGEILLQRGLGGISINTLEAKIENIDDFTLKRRNPRIVKRQSVYTPGIGTTEAQQVMKLIGRDPINCWKDPAFVERYMAVLHELAVPVIHRARIVDLIKRAHKNEITFPRKIVSEGTGPSILYNAYHDPGIIELLKRYELKTPIITDRDSSQAMIDAGNNPRQVLGDMRGINSAFKNKEFDMVDNASIFLLENSKDVKKSLEESHRILKQNGLLGLTIENAMFCDGSSDCEINYEGKIIKRDFYAGLEQLGFQVLTEKNQGFAVSKSLSNRLADQINKHFAEAYQRKLNDTYFLLARKIDNPQQDIDPQHFFWIRPGASEEKQKEEEDRKQQGEEKVRDPRESKSIIVVGKKGKRKGGRVARVNRDGIVEDIQRDGDE